VCKPPPHPALLVPSIRAPAFQDWVPSKKIFVRIQSFSQRFMSLNVVRKPFRRFFPPLLFVCSFVLLPGRPIRELLPLLSPPFVFINLPLHPILSWITLDMWTLPGPRVAVFFYSNSSSHSLSAAVGVWRKQGLP